MDKTSRIADAILAHADAIVFGSPPMPVFFEGTIVKPPNIPKYFYVEYKPNFRVQRGIGDADSKIHEGILYIRVNWLNGAGLIAPLEAAEAVLDHFARDKRLHGDGFRVEWVEAGASPPFNGAYASNPTQGPARMELPVTIRWRAFTNG